MTGRPVLLIAGPTASGKSAAALDAARAFAGTVVNADSMQLYRDLEVLSARPSAAVCAEVPHRLYGTVDGAVRMSAARWAEAAGAEIAAAHADGRLPILVGGTGLYFRALVEGLSPIPDVPEDVRRAVTERHRALGGAAFHAELARRDPETAARLRPGDSQRLIRAAEVLAATGRSISAWQAQPGAGPDALRFAMVLFEPPRAALYAACEARLRAMVEAGALEEVRALVARGLDPGLPVMKAVGVPELAAAARGEIPLDAAVERAQRATRRYAKRQLTWFRNQRLPQRVPCHGIEAQYSESFRDDIFVFIRHSLLTG